MSKSTRLEDKSAQREARYAPRRPKRDPATYQLPQMLAAAIATNRGELCEAFARAVLDERNEGVPRQSVADMARMIGDLIEDRHLMLLRLQDLQDGLKQVRNQVAAFEVAMADALGHAHGTDLEEDALAKAMDEYEEECEEGDPSPTEIVQHLLKASDLGK